MSKTLKIGIVAGEASGDILGASLIAAMQSQLADVGYNNIEFVGVGGPLMIEQGFESLFPMERLSVMGLIEPLKRLRELLGIRRSLKDYFLQNPPDIFIGIDSPDFNLSLEQSLKEQNILTVHYVSPSVWAWRQGRIKKIIKAVDRMLTLLPFEAQFYREHSVPVTFVGHPLADEIPLESVGVEQQGEKPLVAILPGSRGGEVRMMLKPFLETARWLVYQRSDIQFILPAANETRMEQIKQLVDAEYKDLPLELVLGNSRESMAKADVVLMASGTTSLEALLLKKPMVVAYKMANLSYFIISRLVKSRFFSLPNLLANEELVPELVQKDVRPEMLGPLVLERLSDKQGTQSLVETFTKIHKELKQDASQHAASVLFKMIKAKA